MAKFGTVALTRSFTQKGKDGPWKKDGIKAMALCPFFANTKLVTSRISLDKLEKQYKAEGKGTPLQMRVLETPEVNRVVTKLFGPFFDSNIIFIQLKLGDTTGEGACQMYILLHEPFLVKLATHKKVGRP